MTRINLNYKCDVSAPPTYRQLYDFQFVSSRFPGATMEARFNDGTDKLLIGALITAQPLNPNFNGLKWNVKAICSKFETDATVTMSLLHHVRFSNTTEGTDTHIKFMWEEALKELTALLEEEWNQILTESKNAKDPIKLGGL